MKYTAHLRWFNCITLMLLLFLASSLVVAEESSESEMGQTAYLQIKPTIITNYQGPLLKYVRADIAIRVGKTTQSDIETHTDAVKDILIMLLARQDKETLTSQDGIESVKEEAKEEIVAFLESENAKSDVVEVLFMSFLVE